MTDTLVEKIGGKGARIVFTKGSDPRTLEAAIRLHKENVVVLVLLRSRAEIAGSATVNEWNTEGIEALDPIEYKNIDMMVTRVIELRKDKLDEVRTREVYLHRNFFSIIYVKLSCVGGLLGGTTYSTADTVRPALQLIKTRPGNSIVSSCFILVKDGEENLVMGDCSTNINPNADDLAEITLQAVRTVRQLGVKPRVGLLSYSILGSTKGASVAKIDEAVIRLKHMPLDFAVESEVQFDCAVALGVARLKTPNPKVARNINTLIFSNIDAESVGYEIASRLDGYEAIGPILQDLNAPINDLSRGYSVGEVLKTAIVTVTRKYMDI